MQSLSGNSAVTLAGALGMTETVELHWKEVLTGLQRIIHLVNVDI